ncbi:MAG: condensation domain-containing protein, partial [Actinomycetota bacterium]
MSTSDTVVNAVSDDPFWLPTGLDIPEDPRVERFPATALQAGMLFHARAEPGTGVDIEQISITFTEDLDPVRLLESWRIVFARHRLLGSTFGWDTDGRPFTELGHPYTVPVQYMDWRNEQLVADSIAAVTAEQRSTDFDLTNGPLHRLVVARTDQTGWWLLWTFHHTILDGRSFPLLLQEIISHYDAEETGAEDSRANPSGTETGTATDFGRYLHAVAERAADLDEATADHRFWRDQLSGFEAASTLQVVDRALDHDGPQPTVANLEENLTEEQTEALRRLVEQTDASLNTCVQTAWHLLLRHYTQQDVITFGATRACRHAVADSADMIGLLINTVPLSLPAVVDETVGELLGRLRSAQRALRDHETTPLPAIMAAADTGGNPLFDSIVVYDDASLDARMQAAGLGSSPDRTRRFRYEGQTNFPLTLLAYGDRELSLRLEYKTDHYDRAFATRIMTHLRALLVGLAENLDRPAADLPYLTEAETEQYRRWNATEVDYQLDTTLHARFETQVAKTPDRPALQLGDRTLTFEQFNQRANQLAHHLQERGVGPDRFVGIFSERSFELMIAIYAIIKAGGAYVPLDPDHPADRLAFMADDAGLQLILTQPHLV